MEYYNTKSFFFVVMLRNAKFLILKKYQHHNAPKFKIDIKNIIYEFISI